MEDVHYLLKMESVSGLVMNSNTGLLAGKGRPDDIRPSEIAKWELEHFREKAYTDGNGGLVIPARAIKKALMQACRFLPEKPKGVSFKSYGPFIESALLIPSDARLSATVKDLKPLTLVVSLDPSKGNKSPRGPRTRPMIPPPWTATCEAIVFDPILKQEVLERIAERAGKQCGLLDARAIDFGRCLISVQRM